MTVFGKRIGGGRRVDGRFSAPLVAQLSTLAKTFRTVLVDLSATGARLQGSDLPRHDDDLYFSAGDVKAVATVKWRRDMECGIQFCEPLPQEQVIALRTHVAEGANLPPEMRAALQDWVMGIAR